MGIEDTKVIDLSATGEDGTLELVIFDSGTTTNPEERLELLQTKITTYLRYLFSDEFAEDNPGADPQSVRIRVMCATPPTDEMSYKEVAHPEHPDIKIPVHYQIFKGNAEDFLPNGDDSESDSADVARGARKIRNFAFGIGGIILLMSTIGQLDDGSGLIGGSVGAGIFFLIGICFWVYSVKESKKGQTPISESTWIRDRAAVAQDQGAGVEAVVTHCNAPATKILRHSGPTRRALAGPLFGFHPMGEGLTRHNFRNSSALCRES